MLPDFLGIGCYRAGTTWLHDLLNAHPDAYVPQRRKEIHFFFGQNYERGLQWYESFFPDQGDGSVYKAVGEIGPGYLYHPESIERIASVPAIRRFLIILRDPVERAFSHYRWRVRYFKHPPTFMEYAAGEPRILEDGLYAKYLEPWASAFERGRFLILMLEQIRRDSLDARRRVAEFLNLNPDRFPSDAGLFASNRSKALARPALNFVLARTYNWFIRNDLDRLIRPFKKTGKRIMSMGGSRTLPALDDDTRLYLRSYYAQPNAHLAELMRLDLADWQ